MATNRSDTPHIPKKSYLSISPSVVREAFTGLDPEIATAIGNGLSKLFNKFATDERLNYDVIEKNLGGYSPLQPWGVVGEPTWDSNPWYGIYADETSALNQDGPSFQFGISSSAPGVGSLGLVFLADAGDSGVGYIDILLDEDGGSARMHLSSNPNDAGAIATFQAETQTAFIQLAGGGPDVGTAELYAWGTGSAEGGGLYLTSPGGGIADLITDDSLGYTSGQFHLQASGDAYLHMWCQDDGAGSTTACMTISRSTVPPNVTGTDSARLFVDDDGSGKARLRVVWDTGDVTTIATQP